MGQLLGQARFKPHFSGSYEPKLFFKKVQKEVAP